MRPTDTPAGPRRRAALALSALALAAAAVLGTWLWRSGDPPHRPADPAARRGAASPGPGPGGAPAPEAPEPGRGPPASPRGAATLLARVVDAGTGRALSSEPVSLVLRGPGGARGESVRTDVDGRFRVEGLEAGAYALVTRHADYVPDSRSVRVAPESREEVLIPLEQGEWLAGDVVDVRGAPVEGASIRLAMAEGPALDAVTATTAADGSFLAKGLREGAWRLAAGRQGFRLARRELRIPAAGPVRIELLDDSGYDVLVTDPDGTPVLGARLRSLRRTEGVPSARGAAVSGPEGMAHLPGLPADPAEVFDLEVSHDEYPTVRKSVSAADLEGAPYVVVLDRGADLPGRVIGPEGEPVPDAEVRFLAEDGPFRRVLRSTSTGEFRFEGIPRGTYRIVAVTRDRGIGVLPAVEVGGTARAGAAPVEVRLARGDGELGGRILDSGGAPRVLCPVSIEIPADELARGGLAAEPTVAPSGSLALETVSAQDGSFRFSALPVPAGSRATVAAGGDRGNSRARASAVVGTRDLVLRVDRAGSIRAFLPGGGPPTSFTAVLARDDGSGEERRHAYASTSREVEIRDVPPGAWTLTLFVEGSPAWRANGIEVLAGRETGPVELAPLPR